MERVYVGVEKKSRFLLNENYIRLENKLNMQPLLNHSLQINNG